jgi:hypothetical protein
VGVPFIPSPGFESRGTGTYQAESPFIDARSRHPASPPVTESEITKYVTPSQGTAGSILLLHLRTKYDLTADQTTFVFMFGSKKCVGALQKVDTDDDFYNYALSVEVPPFPLTNSWDPTMMLKLQMEDKNGRLFREIDAGKFTFTDMSPNLAAYQAPPEIVKKRKYSNEYGEESDYPDHAAKRNNSLRFQAKPRSISSAYSAASLSPLPAQSSLVSNYGYSSSYDMQKQVSSILHPISLESQARSNASQENMTNDVLSIERAVCRSVRFQHTADRHEATANVSESFVLLLVRLASTQW